MSTPAQEPSGSSSLYEIGGALVGTALSMTISILNAKSEQDRNNSLVEEFNRLSDIQKKELNDRLSHQNSELKREEAFFDYLSESEKNRGLQKLKKERILKYSGVGLGLLLLGVVVYKLKNRNG